VTAVGGGEMLNWLKLAPGGCAEDDGRKRQEFVWTCCGVSCALVGL